MNKTCPICNKMFDDQSMYTMVYCSDACADLASQQIKQDYFFTQIETQKINLQPGDTLMVTVKNNYVEHSDIRLISEQFNKVFPKNKVFVFNVDIDGDIKFATVSQPEIKVEEKPNLGYCSDCDCGKKEAAEGKKNE